VFIFIIIPAESVQALGPRFNTEPSSEIIFTNDSGTQVTCDVSGEQPLKVEWVLSNSGAGHGLAVIPGLREIHLNGTLHFPAFPPSKYRPDVHAATYLCIAENSFGRLVSKDIHIRAGI
jgi:hypothetical protein